MTPDQTRRIAEIFEEAVELPAVERRALLARCREEPAVLQEVESLLAADTELGPESGAAERPRLLGPYRLLRTLGEGGMSTVFLGLRDDGEFRRRVAVKLIRGEISTPELERRFEIERQILASLDHPGIAKLLDAGRSESGAPYVVLEYVEGEPIDQYCNRHRLAIRDRLELFGRVCSAVHYAHQNLVVHRDIKPSNILVTERGDPKLLDFGIAKLLNPELTAHGLEPTRRWERLLTPEYASPEQLQGGPITTASDVYSLGVLLYRLLTGALPFDLAGCSLEEAERRVLGAEPQRPSHRVRRREPGAPRPAEEDPAALRATQPRALERALDGDLDAILAKALRKEPQNRFSSAQELAEDLGRHLAGLPVTARRGTWRYRSERFLRRHRLAMAAAGSAGLLLFSVAVVLGVLSSRLAEQRDTARADRDHAQAIAGFLESLFQVQPPNTMQGGMITARSLLDRGIGQIRRDLAGQPRTQAELLSTIGSAYLYLGLYDAARQALEEALVTRERMHGPDHALVVESLARLAALETEVGNYSQAEAHYRRALSLERRLFGAEHPAVTESLFRLGSVLYREGEVVEAERVLRDALASRRALLGDEHPAVAEALDELDQALWAQGRAPEAQPLLTAAFDQRQRFEGARSLAAAASLNNLALVAQARGDLDDAAARWPPATRSPPAPSWPSAAAWRHGAAAAKPRPCCGATGRSRAGSPRPMA